MDGVGRTGFIGVAGGWERDGRRRADVEVSKERGEVADPDAGPGAGVSLSFDPSGRAES